MFNILSVQRKEVRAGDDLVGWNGKPFFHVTRVDRARARGYLVFSGYRLDRPAMLCTEGGNDTGVVQILREVR